MTAHEIVREIADNIPGNGPIFVGLDLAQRYERELRSVMRYTRERGLMARHPIERESNGRRVQRLPMTWRGRQLILLDPPPGGFWSVSEDVDDF